MSTSKKLACIQAGAGWHVRGPKQHYNRRFTYRDGPVRQTVGWEYVHVAVDDATRLAYVEVLPGEKAGSAIAFVGSAIRFFRR